MSNATFCGAGRTLFSKDVEPQGEYDWHEVFDFSTCFEESVVLSVPAIFAVIVVLMKGPYLYKQPVWTNLQASSLYIWKQGLAFVLVLLMVAEFVDALMNAKYDYQKTAPAIQLIGLVAAYVLLMVEHNRGARSSKTLGVFWLLSFIVGILKLRTTILKYERGLVEETYRYGMSAGAFALTILIFILSMMTEPPSFDEGVKPCPESSAGLLSILSFYWLNPLMVLGFSRPLEDDDLWALNGDDQAPSVRANFQNTWNEQCAKSSDPSLVSAFSKSFGFTLYFAGVFKLVQDTLGFMQPQLLKEVIRFVEDRQLDEPTQPAWHGWAYAMGMFGTAFVQSVFLHQYFHRVYITGMRLRSSVMTSVYEKSLKLSNTSRQTSTSGEIVNLMAVDAQRFMEVVTYLHMMWSAPYQITLALYFLYDLMGPSVFSGLAVMILLIPVNTVIAKYQKEYAVKQMKVKDSRIKQMNEVLTGMKVLKLYAWERPFGNKVTELRDDELVALKQSAILRALSMFSWTIAPFFVSLATFITYTTSGNALTPEKAFVALSLFNLLRFPLVMLPMLISAVVQAQVSVARVTKFMKLAEVDAQNVIKLPVPTGPDAADSPAVIVEKGMFAWSVSGFNTNPTLSQIDLTVPFNSLTAVVGPVGCGKSSLVSAMLGNMEKLSGTVKVVNSIAYVPQQAWIQNATLRDNITFNRPFDPMKYQQVLTACALLSDIKMLPAGDMTEIGEKGINLSGGQKQRVSLARAVYSGAHVYFLDDPLSAVDSHVGKHIFEKVIGPKGMLAGKCRILVTHGIQYLPDCEQIFCLRDGRIAESGTYEALIEAGDTFASFIAEYATKQDTESSDTDKAAPVNPETAANEATGALSGIAIKAAPKASDASAPAKGKGSRSEKSPLLGGKDRLTKDEKTEKGAVLRDIYAKYTNALGVGTVVTLVLMYMCAYAAQIGTNKWLAIWAEHDLEDEAEAPENMYTRHANTYNDGTTYFNDNNKTQMDAATLSMYLGVYSALGVGYSLTMLAASIALAYGGIAASAALHHRMLHRVMRAPMEFFDTTPMGRIVNRFSQDVYTIDEMIPRTLSSLISCAGQVLSTIIVIAMTTPMFLAAVVPLGACYYLIQRYYIATSRQLKRLESVSRSPIYAHFSETLSGVATIKAYNVANLFRIENENKVDFNLQAYYPSVAANRWLAMRLEFLGNLVILFAAIFAVNEAENNILAGDVGLSLSYAMSVTQTLNWMVRMATELETNIVAVERVDEYTQIKTERPEILPRRPPLSWPKKGRIVFKDLGVRYREGMALVLKGISCTIEGGEKIGIVGRTGAGKSSLMVALFNLIEPAQGSIDIDGEDIQMLGLEDLRSKITIMPQDAVLFAGTLRANIDPFNAYDDKTLWQALETSHLSAFVQTLEKGLESEIAEGGENFSVGQRQLVCLARAVLRKTKVLVLDEATAACDLETDALIQKTIRSEFKDCTVLTIAHRLNTIMDSDRIMVLDKGKISEFASPEDLLKKPAGTFAGMANAAGLIDANGNIIRSANDAAAHGVSSEL